MNRISLFLALCLVLGWGCQKRPMAAPKSGPPPASFSSGTEILKYLEFATLEDKRKVLADPANQALLEEASATIPHFKEMLRSVMPDPRQSRPPAPSP